MKNLTTIGRILYALPFLVFGINHFIMMDYYMGMLTSFIPKTAYVMVLTGLLMILTSISIITGKFVKISTLVLAGLLLLFIITIHIPHLIQGTNNTITMLALLKDISLMGGSLLIAGIYIEKEKAE